MTRTPDLLRLQHGVRWREIWVVLTRATWGVPRKKLGHELNKWDVIAAAHCTGPLASWLAEAVICEAVFRVTKAVQTDLEDFVPTTQRKRPEESSAA